MADCPIIFVLDSNDNSRDIIKSYLSEYVQDDKIKAFSDYNKAVEELRTVEDDKIVLVDISESIDIVEKIRLYTSKVVVLSMDYSTNSIVKALRAGAKEFLPKPVIKEDLKRVITALYSLDDLEDDTAKIISIYSNKGGIGKTTIASNLAVELAKVTRDKVALIDLNLQLGDVSTFLDIQSKFDVSYVIKNLMEKKEEVILQAFEKYKNTSLYVLSDPVYIEESESIRPQDLEVLLKSLKKVFSYIVIDLSSNIDANTLKILDKSDLVFFTTIVNIPAIRNCQRCLTLFRSRNYPKDKVKIVVNRFMESDDISVEDIETAIGEKIYWKIPNNYFSIMEAINKGVAVSEINSNSNIANSFRDFASKISDDIVQNTLVKYRGV